MLKPRPERNARASQAKGGGSIFLRAGTRLESCMQASRLQEAGGHEEWQGGQQREGGPEKVAAVRSCRCF